MFRDFHKKSIMNTVSKFWNLLVEKPAGILVGVLAILLTTFLAVFLAVMFSENSEEYISCLLGLSEKSEILKFLGIGMGGVLLALQALASHKRASAMEDSAKAQADAVNAQAKAIETTEQGQRQERLKNAIEHLGHGSVSVRLGGAYELFHLAQDTMELRRTVLNILCAHIRWTTGDSKYREVHKLNPSEEIQSLLTLLFVQDHQVFSGLCAYLQGSWLNGSNLEKARLGNAVLPRAYLQNANLGEARLQGANLDFAHMQKAMLYKTRLQEASLIFVSLQEAQIFAYMQGVVLDHARLQGALVGSFLQGSNLSGADLRGADLGKAYLQGVNFDGAYLQGVFLCGAQLQGANLSNVHLQGATSLDRPSGTKFSDHIRNSTGKESDVSEAIFEGGLSRENVNFLVEGLSGEKANKLRGKLEAHVDRQEKRGFLPENSGAIAGFYTEEEAEEWIAEHERFMPDFFSERQ